MTGKQIDHIAIVASMILNELVTFRPIEWLLCEIYYSVHIMNKYLLINSKF